MLTSPDISTPPATTRLTVQVGHLLGDPDSPVYVYTPADDRAIGREIERLADKANGRKAPDAGTADAPDAAEHVEKVTIRISGLTDLVSRYRHVVDAINADATAAVDRWLAGDPSKPLDLSKPPAPATTALDELRGALALVESAARLAYFHDDDPLETRFRDLEKALADRIEIAECYARSAARDSA